MDTANGIEVGLRAKYRNLDTVINTPTDDYGVAAGACLAAPCTTNGPHPTYALWNYEFSIDLRPNGVGALTLADIATNTTLTVTDVTTGATGTVNPLTHWVDDTGFGSGPGGATGLTTPDKHTPQTTTDWGVQNSENLGFGDSPIAGLFNPNSSDEYDFVLTVINNSGVTLASTDIEVQVTPEPSAVILLGTIILGAFVLERRRRQTA